MVRKTLSLLLTLAFLGLSLPAPGQVAGDPEVAMGIKQVEEGDHDAAIVTLDAATRRLAAQGMSRQLGDAYLYLGIAYLAKGYEMSAKARFREALAQIKDLKLSADKFPPKVIEVFETARGEMAKAPPPTPAPPPRNQPSASPPPKKGGAKKPLILVGAGVAIAGGVVAAAGRSSSEGPASGSYRIDYADTQALTSHGGSGGSPYQLPCPSGSLAVGIRGEFSSYIVTISLICAVLQPDGRLGAETLGTEVGGSGSRGSPFTLPCTSGSVVVQVRGATAPTSPGNYIQNFGIGCAPLPDWVGGVGAIPDQLPTQGREGGATFTEACTPGYAVDRFSGGAGGVVDRLAATCVRVRR